MVSASPPVGRAVSRWFDYTDADAVIYIMIYFLYPNCSGADVLSFDC